MRRSHIRSTVFFIFVLLSPCISAQAQAITVRGAGSMLSLAQKLSDFYRSEYPGTAVNSNVAEDINAIPSDGMGIWQAVHPATQLEKEALRGRFGAAAQQIPIAIQGVLVIVNRGNPVRDLTVDQLRGIFTGKIENWSQLGGTDRAIHLYSTESLIGYDTTVPGTNLSCARELRRDHHDQQFQHNNDNNASPRQAPAS